jgi:hypothetical protein
MPPAVRRAAVAIAAVFALSVLGRPVVAQGAKVDPCSLLTRAEVQSATGKTNYQPADRGEPGDGPGGGDPCTYDNVGFNAGPNPPPAVNVVAIAPNQRGRYVDWYKKQPVRPGCARESVAGLGVEGFLESCQRSPDVRVYMRGRSIDAIVGIDVKPMGGAAAAKPVVLALAKSVAARIK